MKATYQQSWLWFLVGILMVPTAYGQGETILGAYFMNGNTNVFSSRIYLWNPSDTPGDVTVRVFTLPLTSGMTQELTTEPQALGTLGAKSAFNIKLAEDILTPIGVSVPYTADGGNLTLEFTIGAAGVQGVAQVFSGDFAFGTYPLQVISATGTNTATGNGALQANTTGSDNTATGYQALLTNTTGSGNTASGRDALKLNTTGIQNTATGVQALLNNTTGNFNTASGFSALLSNTTGSFNTASGVNVLGSNTIGVNNTASGLNALFNNTTGGSNIAVGNQAGVNATTGHDNIYIGNRGVVAESNTIRIGDGSIHTSAFIAGIQPLGGASQVVVNNDGQLGTPISSKRFKKDIHDMGEASTNLMHLRPVTFRYKKEYDAGDGRLQYGLIAEEVAEVYPELVVYDDQGRAKTVVYQQLSGMLLNEFQKQHRLVQELTERLTRLEQVLTAQQSLAVLKAGQ